MVIETRTYTIEDLWQLSHSSEYSEKRLELSEGELIEMSPAGGKHGWIAQRFTVRIGSFVDEHDAGYVTAAETGYILYRNPGGRDTVRAPDVGYIRKDRLPEGMPDKYIPQVPDLAVEIVSPTDEAVEIEGKLNDYLKYGVKMIVLCYPKHQTVHVFSTGNHQILRPGDTLDTGEVLPGFTITVNDIFGLE